MDALAVSLGLIACLVIGQMGQQPSADELAADAWIIERDVVSLLHTMSSPVESCYNMTLPNADMSEDLLMLARDRAGMMLATSCDPTIIAQMT
ncbi:MULTISPECIES: hypothetical protein [Phenylobacterium]|uniref:Uncharacterized protein n=1 Tax=Phenylobacterium koreense TaxID=266125 RepID=A0ABV2EE46_9CAUL